MNDRFWSTHGSVNSCTDPIPELSDPIDNSGEAVDEYDQVTVQVMDDAFGGIYYTEGNDWLELNPVSDGTYLINIPILSGELGSGIVNGDVLDVSLAEGNITTTGTIKRTEDDKMILTITETNHPDFRPGDTRSYNKYTGVR